MAAEKATRKKAEKERLAQEKAERERLVAQERERIAAGKAEKKRIAALQNVERSPGPSEPKQALQGKLIGSANQSPTDSDSNPSTPNSVAQAPAKISPKEKVEDQDMQNKTGIPTEAQGITMPTIHGDLKLEITAQSDFKINVGFRSYPKSRRNRPMTKAEAKREQKIKPLTAMTKEHTKEVVIETAGDGIYVFLAEPDSDASINASFLLKIYEDSIKAKTKSIGKRSLTGKAVIVKILMPEGILWDDESAFSGSMEDSESITKFNSETGLVWKEFKE